MATITGSEYDHITISDGTNQTVHYLKDTVARAGIEAHFPATGQFVAGSGSVSADYASAVGQSTTASGARSHAEGLQSIASGNDSHAEGTMYMYQSGGHAQLFKTTASGTASHAEGGGTTASGNYAHSEGFMSNAQSIGSHTEGYRTGASGAYAHAEGKESIAYGDNSHAEGLYSRANHRSQHVFGEYNILDNASQDVTARGEYVEIVGNGTGSDGTNINYSNARTLDWSGNERLAGGLTLGAGTANETSVTASELAGIKSAGQSIENKADKANTVLTGSLSLGRKTNTTVGNNSFAIGNNVEASGTDSHAEGWSTTASGNYSHSEGAFTTASGMMAHSEGGYTTASGLSSHAEGVGTISNHSSQHVFGEYNIADPSENAASVRGTYVEIVGNGNDDNTRSNARTLDWSGNETLAGSLTLGKGTANEVTITAAQLQSLLALLN